MNPKNAQLKYSLVKYANITGLWQLLETQGIQTELNTLITKVARIWDRSKDSKKQLKVLISEVIDQCWKMDVTDVKPEIKEFKTPPKEGTDSTRQSTGIKGPSASMVSPQKFRSSAHRRSLQKLKVQSAVIPSRRAFSPQNSQSSIKYTSVELRELYARDKGDLTHMSKFWSPTGHCTFNKEKKQHAVETSPVTRNPGPGHYQPDEDQIRSRSPSARMPQGGSRVKFLLNEENPGPCDYYP